MLFVQLPGGPDRPAGAGVFGTTVNVINNIIGAGFLGLPFCVKETSMPVTLVLLMLVCGMNAFSFWLLAMSCSYTGMGTYLEIGRQALGRRLGFLCQLTAVGYAFCSCISYATLVGDFLVGKTGVSASVIGDAVSTSFLHVTTPIIVLAAAFLSARLLCQYNANPPSLSYSLLVAIMSILFVVALAGFRQEATRDVAIYGFATFGFAFPSVLRRIEPLRWISSVSVTLTVLVAFLCIHALMIKLSDPELFKRSVAKGHVATDGAASWIDGLATAVPIINVAFTAHYNGPRYFNELAGRHMEDFTTVLCIALGFALGLYLTVAITGDMAFGPQTQGDLLLNFKGVYTPAMATRLAFLFILWSDFPKVLNGVREGMLQLSNRGTNDSVRLPVLVILTLVLVLSVTSVAVCIPQVAVVLKFKGAVFGMPMVYVFPPLIFLKLGVPHTRLHLVGCCLLIAWGCVFFTIGIMDGIQGIAGAIW